MPIKHPTIKVPGNTLAAIADWNANHTIDPGTILRSATLIVAASDSLDTTNADYFCDGVADEVQINAAIAALPATGGSVCLMDGTFNIAATITILKNNVTLAGCGRNTIIYLADSSDVNMIQVSDATQRYGIRITNLKLDGNGPNNTGNSNNGIYLQDVNYVKIDHCWIENVGGGGVFCHGIGAPPDGPQYVIILNNHFYDNGGGSVGGAIHGVFMSSVSITGNVFHQNTYYSIVGMRQGSITGNVFYNGYIEINQASGSSIVSNYFEGATNSISLASGDDENTITGNMFKGYVNLNGSHNNVISGNYMQLRKFNIYGGAHNNTIVGNTIYNTAYEAILLTGNNNTVTGNSIEESAKEGIKVDGNNNVISNNSIFKASDGANDTYAGILLTGTSTYNVVSGNRVSSTAANKHKYGIREAAAADDWNLLHGNILTDAVTTNLSSQGPNSVSADNIAP